MRFLNWFADNWEKVGMCLAGLIGLVVVSGFTIAFNDGPRYRDTRGEDYVNCLKAVLAKGSLSDAETMCAFLRTKP